MKSDNLILLIFGGMLALFFFFLIRKKKTASIVVFTFILLGLLLYLSDSFYYKPWKMFIFWCLYAVTIGYLCKKSLNYKIPLLIFSYFGCILLILELALEPLSTLNLWSFSYFFAVISFYFFAIGFVKKQKRNIRIFFLSFFLVSNFVLCFYVYFFSMNFGTFGTSFGEYDYKIKNAIYIHTTNEIKKITDNKTYVLDMWNPGCGVCFIKFPKFNKLKNKYADSNSIDFIAVNIYRSEKDIESSQKMFDQRNFNFKTYYINQKEADELKTNIFPTTLVIKNGKIVFRGHIETLTALHFLYL